MMDTHNTQTVRVKLLTSLLDRLGEDFPDRPLSQSLNEILLRHFDAKGTKHELPK